MNAVDLLHTLAVHNINEAVVDVKTVTAESADLRAVIAGRCGRGEEVAGLGT